MVGRQFLECKRCMTFQFLWSEYVKRLVSTAG